MLLYLHHSILLPFVIWIFGTIFLTIGHFSSINISYKLFYLSAAVTSDTMRTTVLRCRQTWTTPSIPNDVLCFKTILISLKIVTISYD